MYCIESKNLTHRFSKNEIAVNHVFLQVPENSIYGFLGPNGAGKTTTLRLLLGLIQKQEGTIEIFNQSFEKNKISILQKVGSLIESPSIYAQLTARENLKVFQKVYRCSQRRIDEVLQLVNLTDTANKKAGKFSLGMKQRLGIALALLNKPTLLILDEPTNGLDPNSIIETRDLLRRLNQDEKITILISSHLLSEIEKLVTHVGIIHRGNLIFQGSLQALHNTSQKFIQVSIRTLQNEKALHLITQKKYSASIVGDTILLHCENIEDISNINQFLVEQDVQIFEINIQKNDLEKIFMNLINQ